MADRALMVRFLVIFLFGPLAAVELLLYGRFDLLLLGGTYLGLVWQADWAADRYIAGRTGAASTAPDLEPPSEEIEVPSLGAKGKHSGEEPFRQERVIPVQRLASSIAPITAKPAPRATVRPLPASPRFQGAPHEVLGVGENAGTRTIGAAFRFWIKRFHPDHGPALPISLANERVQRLTTARDKLLSRRRSHVA